MNEIEFWDAMGGYPEPSHEQRVWRAEIQKIVEESIAYWERTDVRAETEAFLRHLPLWRREIRPGTPFIVWPEDFDP